MLGYCTVFNSLFPRRGAMNLPFLGISISESLDPRDPVRRISAHQTWVLTTLNMQGYAGLIWIDGYVGGRYAGLRTASEIDYWGHCSTA